MERRKLIFFVAADPRSTLRPAWSAYHFAEVASRAGLKAEVRLAGDAVYLAREDAIAPNETGAELRRKVRAGAGEPFLVSL